MDRIGPRGVGVVGHPVEVSPRTTTASALVALAEADDGDGLLAAVPGLSDEVRAEAWATLRRALSTVLGPDDLRGVTDAARNERIRARSLVALAVGPAEVVRQVGSYILLAPPALQVDRVLASRSPEWREAFSEATLRYWASETEVGLMGPIWWEWWTQLRRLERAGLLPANPTYPGYLVLMIRGLLFSGSIVDAISQDPDLVEGSIWALFEPAPGVQKALLGSERFWDPSNTWRVALVRLALAGVVNRERLASAATVAADDERMGRNHRAWYKKIPKLLADPSQLPNVPDHGPPPPGNQLHRST